MRLSAILVLLSLRVRGVILCSSAPESWWAELPEPTTPQAHCSPITRVEPPVLVNAGARDEVSPAPIAITPGSEAMMRFWVCWPSAWGFCSRLCRAVRVLTGGRVPPGAEICVREGQWNSCRKLSVESPKAVSNLSLPALDPLLTGKTSPLLVCSLSVSSCSSINQQRSGVEIWRGNPCSYSSFVLKDYEGCTNTDEVSPTALPLKGKFVLCFTTEESGPCPEKFGRKLTTESSFLVHKEFTRNKEFLFPYSPLPLRSAFNFPSSQWVSFCGQFSD